MQHTNVDKASPSKVAEHEAYELIAVSGRVHRSRLAG